MKTVYKILFIAIAMLTSVTGFAQTMLQGNGKPEMAVGMRANGKIYVVVAVLVTILLGLFFYLMNLDKKIGRMEKDARS